MKIFTCPSKPWRSRARALLNILLGLLFLHLTSLPVWGVPLPPCGCPDVPCGEGEYCRIDDSCEPSGTGRCYAEGELPPCGCPDVPCGEGEYCRIDDSCEPSGTGRCYSEEDGNGEDGDDGGIICPVPTPIGDLPCDLPGATAFLFGVVVKILTALAIIIFIAGGVQVMASGDNPEGLEEGKKKMTAAVSGFFFLLLFVIIIDMIGIRMLGISVLREVIKPWL